MENKNSLTPDWSFYLWAGLALSLILSTALAELIAVLLILLWLGQVSIRRRLQPIDYPMAAFILVWIALRILSIVFSISPELSVKGWEKVWIPFIYFPAAGMTLSGRKGGVLLSLLITGSLVASVWGSYKVLSGLELRASSFSGGYYTLGVHLCLVLALILAYLVTNPDRRTSIWLYLSGSMLIAGIFFTYTRSCYLAALFSLLGVTIYRKRKLALLLIPVALLVLLGPTRQLNRTDNLGQTDLTTGRIQIWKVGLAKLPDTPLLGYGVNTFLALYPEETRSALADKGVKGWHNDFLQIFLESGPLTLLVYVTILCLGVRIAWRNYRSQNNGMSSTISLGVILIILNWIIIGFFANPSGDPLNAIFFWSFLGIANNEASRKE